jgi:hypothetical protein
MFDIQHSKFGVQYSKAINGVLCVFLSVNVVVKMGWMFLTTESGEVCTEMG